MEGFLLIDKPKKLTSHDVVDRVRRITGERRVGHAGTLDPFATGLLIVGVGRGATREMKNLVGLEKEYEATFLLGARSDTDDRTGRIEKVEGAEEVEEVKVRKAIETFLGEIEQTPPDYAAIKIGGKKMYEEARKGKPLKAEPRQVRIDVFDLLASHGNKIDVRIACSSGTYIRALARDLGKLLGVGGYVEELRRTKIGSFSVSESKTLKILEQDGALGHLIAVKDVLERAIKT